MPRVEVVYALPDRQTLYALDVEAGATVRDVIERSGVLSAFPEIDLARNRVGIFGKLAALSTPVCDDDRVEILRPLEADPKEARRKRAVRGR
ncbi:MAG TPA: RnfH family protein [Burkholderiales bacterium]|nr:RnfH family protein [Burkholderiales bacterium]